MSNAKNTEEHSAARTWPWFHVVCFIIVRFTNGGRKTPSKIAPSQHLDSRSALIYASLHSAPLHKRRPHMFEKRIPGVLAQPTAALSPVPRYNSRCAQLSLCFIEYASVNTHFCYFTLARREAIKQGRQTKIERKMLCCFPLSLSLPLPIPVTLRSVGCCCCCCCWFLHFF